MAIASFCFRMYTALGLKISITITQGKGKNMLDKNVWQDRWKNAEAYIFDLDGTLLNSIDDLASSSNHALKTLGYPMRTIEEVRGFVGNGIPKMLERSFPDDIEYTPEIQAELLEEFHKYYVNHLWDYTMIYPGINETIALLQSKGKKLFVLTNKEQSAAEKIVEHFWPGVFIEVAGEAPNRALKPSPDYLVEMLAKANLTPSQAVMIGDGDTDVEVALSSGALAAAAGWGFKGAEFLSKYNPDGILAEASDMLELI